MMDLPLQIAWRDIPASPAVGVRAIGTR